MGSHRIEPPEAERHGRAGRQTERAERASQTPYKYSPIVHDHLLRGPIHLHLVVDLSDLRSLLFER